MKKMDTAQLLKFSGLAFLLPIGVYALYYEQDYVDLTLPLPSSRSSLSYARVREKVLGPYCFRCHAAGSNSGELRFDEYELAKAAAPRILATAVEESRMPPSRPLSRYRKAFLRAWIEAGAPESPTN